MYPSQSAHTAQLSAFIQSFSIDHADPKSQCTLGFSGDSFPDLLEYFDFWEAQLFNVCPVVKIAKLKEGKL